jgi:hypothetical protein
MLKSLDSACVLAAVVGLRCLLQARREQAALAQQVDAPNEDVQCLATQVNGDSHA